MTENKQQPLPSFESLDDLVEFFETSDMGEYEVDLPEAQFDVDLQKKLYLVAIDDELNARLTKIAQYERVPAEALVNLWLREKIATYARQ
jgi:hypothetical protein